MSSGGQIFVSLDRLVREGFSQFDPVGALQTMANLRTEEAQGAAPTLLEYLPPTGQAAEAAGLTDRDAVEAIDYYKTTRAQHPSASTNAVHSHLAAVMGWDAFAFAEVLLTQPLMVVVGDRVGAFGAYRDGVEIHGRAASRDKHLVVIEGASHYDLYDAPQATRQALDRVVPFLRQHLGA